MYHERPPVVPTLQLCRMSPSRSLNINTLRDHGGAGEHPQTRGEHGKSQKVESILSLGFVSSVPQVLVRTSCCKPGSSGSAQLRLLNSSAWKHSRLVHVLSDLQGTSLFFLTDCCATVEESESSRLMKQLSPLHQVCQQTQPSSPNENVDLVIGEYIRRKQKMPRIS